MAKLRIRIELSRGGVGVPLHKLASVITESQKFLNLLCDDVQIDQQRGEWLGFDFDHESLNFTAEFVGPVTNAQVEAFNAAFDGTTSLRKDTIAQFLQITDAIGEDEVIGFGLYQNDETASEPVEWRCLSRRDALRIADEVQVLMGAGQAPHLPAASDPSLAARMFGERRDRAIADPRFAEYVREMESGLSSRIDRVENQVQKHAGMIGEMNARTDATETSFRNLLSAFEGFCNQATRNIERMSPAALPAPEPAKPAPASAPKLATAEPALKSRDIIVAAAGIVLAVGVAIGVSFWPSGNGPTKVGQKGTTPGVFPSSSDPSTVAAASVDDAAKSQKQNARLIPTAASGYAPGSEIMLEATQPTWVSMKDQEGKAQFAQLLNPGSSRTIKLQGNATLRTGNAGGLIVSLNGNSIGTIGPLGQVREIIFKDGRYMITPP